MRVTYQQAREQIEKELTKFGEAYVQANKSFTSSKDKEILDKRVAHQKSIILDKIEILYINKLPDIFHKPTKRGKYMFSKEDFLKIEEYKIRDYIEYLDISENKKNQLITIYDILHDQVDRDQIAYLFLKILKKDIE